MAGFDAELRKVAAYVTEMRSKGRPTREFACPHSVTKLQEGLPVRVGAGANRGIIFRSETFAELGNPVAGSCAFVIWTTTPSLVRDGIVSLVGPDIQEAAGTGLPFGQVILIGGKNLGAEDHQSLHQGQYIADQLEGYMVKSSSRNMWSRVSKEVGARGFSFETLGRALMAIFKSTLPKVEAMEVVFVTSSKEDVQVLDRIGQQVVEIGSELVKEHWKSKGYDLDCDLDCGSCHDKEVCDDIRDVVSTWHKKKSKKAAVKPTPSLGGH
ncbi:MAG: hypothetical protein ACE5EO_02160 [Candidatus Krumholzibacteriia bacterium]